MFSEDVRTIVELVRYHASLEKLDALPVVLSTAAAGMVLCLGGARSVRTLITALAGICGAVLGVWVSRSTPLPAWLSVTVGTLGIGYLGNMGYRVWVGCGSAIMLCTVMLGIYVGHTVLPHHERFIGATSSGGTSVLRWRVPDAHQVRLQTTTPSEYFNQFRAYFAKQEPDYGLHLALMLVPAAVAGLVFGSLSPYGSTIVWSSLLGSVFLVTAGLTTLVSWHPKTDESYIQNAQWVAWLMLLVTILSIYFQSSTRSKKKKKVSSSSSSDIDEK